MEGKRRDGKKYFFRNSFLNMINNPVFVRRRIPAEVKRWGLERLGKNRSSPMAHRRARTREMVPSVLSTIERKIDGIISP